MAETTATGTEQAAPQQETSRTFTQAELDAIVRERVSQTKSKYADYEALKAKAAKFDETEEASKSELQKAVEKNDALQRQLDALTKANEVTKIRNTVSAATGVPAALLSGDTEDACTEQAKAILNFAKTQPNYPHVPDGGESSKKPGMSARDAFGQWMADNLTNS